MMLIVGCSGREVVDGMGLVDSCYVALQRGPDCGFAVLMLENI
jgi:hypothetical protein